VQSVKVGASQLGRAQLLPPEKDKGTNTGTLVEFKGKDGKSIKSILLGKKYVREAQSDSPYGGGFPVGRYVMVPDNVQSASIVSEAFTEIEPNPQHWLNKDWFKVEKLKAIAVTSTNATNNWKVARESESGPWTLADKKEGEPVDTNKLSSVGYALSSPSFNDVLSPDSKTEPLVTATLETLDNFIYTVRVGNKGTNEDNYPVNVSVAATLVKERTRRRTKSLKIKKRRTKNSKKSCRSSKIS
jgi:hypothetical protein